MKKTILSKTDLVESNGLKKSTFLKNGFELSRRNFIGGLGSAALVAGFSGFSGLLTGCNDDSNGENLSCGEIGPLNSLDRKDAAYELRVNTADIQKNLSTSEQSCNGDEDLFENKIANYSKGLPHNNLGEVDIDAYNSLISALSSGDNNDFENVPTPGDVKLKNPQAGLSFDLIGFDPQQLEMPPAPRFESAETAGEIAELYWMSLLRDIHFSDYLSNDLVQAAADDLSNFSDFRGPKINGNITPQTLFRADIPGVLTGPYLSQFLLKDIPAGPQISEHKIRTLLPIDYLTNYSDWLDVQNGTLPAIALSTDVFDPTARLVRNGRDLAENQHWDYPAQEAINALLIIFGLEGRSPQEVFLANIGVPYDKGNPYLSSNTQAGFVTFHIVDSVRMVIEAMNLALKTAWYQKWFVHRRLRPEEYGGRIHNHQIGSADYPIHEDIFNSEVLGRIFDNYGSYLLPQAFPEGGPIHPAYPSGHATWAGSTITILKAFFDESVVVPDPVVASSDGISLVPYNGSDSSQLTIGGELNKLAWNIAMGRNFAGIHWRTDAIEGLLLGEQIAISILSELKNTYNEDFDGFNFESFDGIEMNI